MTPEERFQKIEETLLATAEMRREADRRWEARLAKIDDNLLVATEMNRTSDRRWEKRFAEHDSRLTRVEQVVASLAAAEKKLFRALDKLADAHQRTDARLEAVSKKLDELADGQKVTRAMLDTLIKNIDSFVRGQGGNGRRSKGGGQ
jgi:chromosome segregation ATPase